MAASVAHLTLVLQMVRVLGEWEKSWNKLVISESNQVALEKAVISDLFNNPAVTSILASLSKAGKKVVSGPFLCLCQA